MPLPSLDLGLVVRYEYLWHRRKDTPTADKDHPACVIATFRNEGVADDFVVYLPISHIPPAEGEVGVEHSSHAKRAAGLDPAPQWILISECNVDTWPQDLRSLPGRALSLWSLASERISAPSGSVRRSISREESQTGAAV